MATIANTNTRKARQLPTHHVALASTLKRTVNAPLVNAVGSNTVKTTPDLTWMETKSQPKAKKRTEKAAHATPTNLVKNLTKSATTTWKDVVATGTTAVVNILETSNKNLLKRLMKFATTFWKAVAALVISAAACTNSCTSDLHAYVNVGVVG